MLAIYMSVIQSALSALTLLVGRQEGHLVCKKNGGWSGVQPDGRCVCLC